MKKVVLFSFLLVTGILGSQFKSTLFPPEFQGSASRIIEFLTMFFLGFIMIHVGYEFEIDKRKVKNYVIDFGVATTAAAIPWFLCALYFVFILFSPEERQTILTWKESFLAGCFAAPTSAGILFSMLAAAGLSASWVFKKARVLAIFDDIATILFLIPLKMMFIGLHWQLGIVAFILFFLLWLAWKYLHTLRWAVTWPWVMSYSALLLILLELLTVVTRMFDPESPIHIEILLPAFVLGCALARPSGAHPHSDDTEEGHLQGPENSGEQRVSTWMSAAFMLMVGLSMPNITNAPTGPQVVHVGWGMIFVHVLWITFLSNFGKMFPLLCYKSEAGFKERLALCIGMWPRGEVGAGVLAVALSYGFSGTMVTVATLSLALNLVGTGFFIVAVKRLIR